MKKILLIVLVALSPLLSFSQSPDQSTIAKFTITGATNNGINVTPILLHAGAYTVFYTSDNDGLIYMANVWPNTNSQSYGPIFDVNVHQIEATQENDKTHLFNFTWSYTNDYDDKTGTAQVEVTKVYTPEAVTFTIKIITDQFEVIFYEGYMDGTIDLSTYDRHPPTSRRYQKYSL